MKKYLSVLLKIILSIPLVSAEEECGLLNLASCLPQKMYEFILKVLNSPIQPLLNFLKSLLTEPVKLSLLSPLWAIILYIISLFYGILMLYSGFNFMISGYDVVKRVKAKEWFLNIFLMIILVQASYFIYELVIDMGSLLTAGVVNLIDPHFFMITADNIINMGLQLLFAFTYVLSLFLTIVILVLRYIIVAAGVVFVPIGIFLYFIPPLKSYGKLILNFLGICVFLTFFDSLIFLVCSRLVDIPLFANFKILIMISALFFANILMFYLMFFSAIKSAFKTVETTAATVASVAKYFA
jgi:hypothetical protein